MGVEMDVAGLTYKVKVANAFLDIVGLKYDLFADKPEQMSIVHDGQMVAAEFLHPYDGFVGIVSSLEGRYHVVNQILGNHNGVIKYTSPVLAPCLL